MQLERLFKTESNSMSAADFKALATALNGYSASDIEHVAKEAAMLALEGTLETRAIQGLTRGQVMPVTAEHIKRAMRGKPPSASPVMMKEISDWENRATK
jgi:SpoVK/Ycf46/Vps4 family AAA+-type ATPase